jgi:hypothetical protein
VVGLIRSSVCAPLHTSTQAALLSGQGFAALGAHDAPVECVVHSCMDGLPAAVISNCS